MKITDLLTIVQELAPGEKYIYFTGAFAFHKSIHEGTHLGTRLEALSEVAILLEEAQQVLLTMKWRDDFFSEYYIIRRSNPPSLSPYLITAIQETQDDFDRDNWIQGSRKIRDREALNRKRVRAS